MATNKKIINLLPEYFRTEKNNKFLSSIVDPLISTPEIERINGYIGSKLTPNYKPFTDFYLKNVSKLRTDYALEPGLVINDKFSKVNDVISYDDLLNELVIRGLENNVGNIFKEKFYAYNPLIDWDKLINFSSYYWLPNGPDVIVIDVENIDVETDILGKAEYLMPNGYKLSNGMHIKFLDSATPQIYTNKTFLVEGVGNSIQLINFDLLKSNEAFAESYNETFDSDGFDEYPFDGDKKIPIKPDYITINKASVDLNPWTRYNRWFHEDVIKITATINNSVYGIDSFIKAKRPIIEFKPNLQLFNFGNVGIDNIDLIDESTTDAFSTVQGKIGYYIDEKLLEDGNRIVFNADKNINVRGNIYKIKFDITMDPPVIDLILDQKPDNLNSVSVNFGKNNAGTSYYYDQTQNKWILSQQHDKLNQSPLFDLFNSEGISYSKLAEKNNFKGNKIFGYDEGIGPNDEILGFPLKYQVTSGIGGYVFKNYFMDQKISIIKDSINSIISSSITFIKKYNPINLEYDLVNVWNKEAQEYKLPIIENQQAYQSTNTVIINSLDNINYQSVSLYVNGYTKNITYSTNSNVINLINESIQPNDAIVLKIVSDELPNENGYYQTPLSLTNNPLNDSIINLTFSELTDHVKSMLEYNSQLTGQFPGNSNLRDLSNYEKLGTRLIINAVPISFAKFFIGKQKHSIFNALDYCADAYNQFKMTFINLLSKVDSSISPANAVEEIMSILNNSKNLNSPFFSSDMLPFGKDRIIREFKISNPDIKIYPIGADIDLTKLSFKSLLVYKNDQQLINNIDYIIDPIDGIIILSDDVDLVSNLDTISIIYYSSTLGCYVPFTPTKLGLYPKFVPEIFEDINANSQYFIRCHDGSLIKAFNDYRDSIILEFEKRVYNNIKVNYNNNLYDITSILPSAFRNNNEILFNKIIKQEFTKWAGKYNVNFTENTDFDEANKFTWNYTDTTDVLFNKELVGSWRNIFRYFYDTDAPNLRPWEMLGLFEKPSWWNTYYGAGPYTSTNSVLWNDLENGFNRQLNSYDEKYARPGLSNIIPVDEFGNLKDPYEFLINPQSLFTKNKKWEIGEASPYEIVWRNSSLFPFVVNKLGILTDPLLYTSVLFDVSKISNNPLGQTSYLDNDFYLNLKKLLISGVDTDQTAGYINFILEFGNQKYKNYNSEIKNDLTYLNFNLVHKLGGFTTKEKLQISIDSLDPVSLSPGVVLPQEDYSITLNTSNPVTILNISGIIVQKNSNKFIIRGYDQKNPYFNVFLPIYNSVSNVITIGGISEKFTEWNNISNETNKGLNSVDTTTANSTTSQYYKQGQIVRYNNNFYRVKIGHVVQDNFNPEFYQRISKLPVKGGVTVYSSNKFSSYETQILYGYETSSIQEVYDIIVGYGHWLETQGFVFDTFNDNFNDIINWKFSAKEFLFWTTQNWADNSLITLSPFSEFLKFNSSSYVVDNVLDIDFTYSLLKADGRSYPVNEFSFSREDNLFTINTFSDTDGLFFASLRLIQKEHIIVFNNYTIFNDTIFDIETGYKQQRMKFTGFRTKNWNGDYFSPGFVYDNVSISNWEQYKIYNPGAVVSYNSFYYQATTKIINENTFDFTKWSKLTYAPENQLLLNFDYKISQFEDFYSLDIDNFDVEQQKLAQHLIGYSPRNYLNNLITNPISRYKFYQGFIKEKGTKKSIEKLSKALSYKNVGEILINEEWAFRVGHYGSFSTFNEIEFNLLEGSTVENPFIIKFVDDIPENFDPLVTYVKINDLLLKPDNITSTSVFVVDKSTFEENNLELLNAGYVRINDVNATAYNKNSILDVANFNDIQNGFTIWIGFLENGGWDVVRYTKQTPKITGVYVNAPGSEITFVTDLYHNLNVGDIISIVNFSDQVNGIHIVSAVTQNTQFSVKSSLTTIVNEELINFGTLYKFTSIRFSTLEKLLSFNNLIDLKYNDKIWIDRYFDGKWAVLEKINNFSSTTIETPDYEFGGQQLGYSIWVNQNSNTILVSSPGTYKPNDYSYGKINVYKKLNNTLEKIFDYSINNATKTFCDATTSTNFGESIVYDISKQYFIAGAPKASNIITNDFSVNTVVLSTGTGTSRSLVNEGLVKISSKDPVLSKELEEIVLLNPLTTSTAENSEFGKSIFINQVDEDVDTLLLVSAPGNNDYNHTGTVFAYNLSNTGTITVNSQSFIIESTSTVTLNVGSKWGDHIVGNKDGSIIAITAPGYYQDSKTGLVQIFNNLNWSQTIYSPESDIMFGDSIAISERGNYLAISSINEPVENYSIGKVFLYFYNFSSEQYELIQVISNPKENSILKFGSKLEFTEDETTLVISALGNNTSKYSQFYDVNENLSVVDNNTTKLFSDIPDSGTVYVYSKLQSYFVLSQELNEVEILEGSKYGYSIAITNDEIFVGAPSYDSLGIQEIIVPTNIIVDINEQLTIEFSNPEKQGSIPVVDIIYSSTTTNTKFISEINILDSGFGYVIKPTVTLKNSLDETLAYLDVKLENDNSKFYNFKKINKNINGYNILRYQDNTVNCNTIKKVSIIDNYKEEIVDYLDVIDPLKGKIAGIADQELSYKLPSDPAVYSIGSSVTIVDPSLSWIDDHVGELWWDLSTAKYIWYEQGEEVYRKNNWGNLFPGSTIDVYEWVKTDLLPSEWATLADSNEGLTKGISGQPKYVDNSILSVKQIYNNVTGAFENVYYYWVKNKVNVPNNVKNRRISAYQVAQYIADPTAAGYKFAQILSSTSVAFSNVQELLNGNTININISFDIIDNNISKHTEWLILEEGNEKSLPNTLLEKKLIDSLLGHDSFGNPVPDPSLTYRNKFGIGIRPQQSLFNDRAQALRNIIDFANSILIKNLINENENYNFTILNSQEEIPDENLYLYDYIFNDKIDIENFDVVNLRLAKLTAIIQNGVIQEVIINDSGYGYKFPPAVEIINNKNAIISTGIDDEGRIIRATIENGGSQFDTIPELVVRPHTAIIINDDTANNKWTSNILDYTSKKWLKNKTQIYNTPLYWEYVDWKSESFNEYKNINYVGKDLYELESFIDIPATEYVKIQNAGSGYFYIFEKVNESEEGDYSKYFNLIYSQNGTIKIKDTLWNYVLTNYSYDLLSLDETLYDQVPDLEILYILKALKEDIFIRNLKVNWNLLFFVAVKYALSEQKLLDWAFKTSFISIKTQLGKLEQRPSYTLNNDQLTEEYIKEVKPYHSKIRNYISSYSLSEGVDRSLVNVNDFDLPSYYNTVTEKFETIEIVNNSTDNQLINEIPWRYWYENYSYTISDIIIANSGTGYTSVPDIIISSPAEGGTTATANAIVSNGSISKIIITNPGNNYVSQPFISIVGGGATVSINATASAIVGGNPIRKNKVNIKFDRYSRTTETFDNEVIDTFICDGNTNEFELSWSSTINKENINAQLDGIFVFSTEYTINFYGIGNLISKFKFLNKVPKDKQILVVRYRKNINLFHAAERINNFYSPTDNQEGLELPMLMKGLQFENPSLQGLSLIYSVTWNNKNTPYGAFVWDDIVENYTKSKLVQTVDVLDDTMYLDTVENIIPGQLISILNFAASKVRKDTYVTEVNTASNYIKFSKPIYEIKSMYAEDVIPDSNIFVTTKNPFYKNLYVDDFVTFTGFTNVSFNGEFRIHEIINNYTFIVKNTNDLVGTNTNIVSTATMVVSSILEVVYSDDTLLERNIITITNTSTTSIQLPSNYDKIVTTVALFNDEEIYSETSSSVYYELIENTSTNGIIFNLYNISSSTNILDLKFYTHPEVEFWKTNAIESSLDTVITGGSWDNTPNLVGALGVNPEDLIIDGQGFYTHETNFAPEELVPGNVIDSVAINVYTKTKNSNALIYSGVLPTQITSTTTFTLSVDPSIDANSGMIVSSNSLVYDRVYDTNFTKVNQYYLEGTSITVPPQDSWTRISYVMFLSGGENILDTVVSYVENQNSAVVESSMNYNDVKSAYVLVNGEPIDLITDLNNFGYVLTSVNLKNKRACVKIYNMPDIKNTIEVWFLSSTYDQYNKINEETFIAADSGDTTFTITNVPYNIQPINQQVIVELINPSDQTRKRLLPPWTNYYEIKNNQTIFSINDDISLSFAPEDIKVYANGSELRQGFDYTLDLINNNIILTNNLLKNGDVLAILTLYGYDFLIIGNSITIYTPINSGSIIKLTSFSNHDELLIRTERFNPTPIKRYTLSKSVINDNYIWVYVNGIPLVHRYDFEILDDLRTVQLNEWIEYNEADEILITSFVEPSEDNLIIGYRIFKDIFDRYDFKRISKYNSTFLTQELLLTSTEIHVNNNDILMTPNPELNKPGVIIIDSERIEYFKKDGNVLKELRRSTLGTAPAKISQFGSTVIDQSVQQTLPYKETNLIQNFTTTNTTTYAINTFDSTATGNAILLSTNINPTDQVLVYYGGTQLKKAPYEIYNSNYSFYDSVNNKQLKSQEFVVSITIDTDLATTYASTASQIVSSILPQDLAYDLDNDGQVTVNDLNLYLKLANNEFINIIPQTTTNYYNLISQNLILSDDINVQPGTNITIIHKKGYIWTGTESLLTSNVMQSKFLRHKPAVLPDVYYYGGNNQLLDSNNFALTDENDDPLEE